MKTAFLGLVESKKFWTTLLTIIASGVAKYFNNPDLSVHIMYLGGLLIGSFALQDHGKEAAAINAEVALTNGNVDTTTNITGKEGSTVNVVNG